MSDHVNLEYLRKEAKTILKQCRAGDRASLERVRAQLPKLASMEHREIAEQIKLADVHHVLAREHGCSNWGELKRYDAPLARFLAAARSGSLKSAGRELAQFPDLVEESIHAACVIGDADAVRYHLGLDRRLLNAEDGGWPPLLYACSSPFHRASERHAAGLVECAGVLLDRGADPNESSALFRASISGNRSVAVLLYQRGATHASSSDTPKAKEAFWGIPADPRSMDQALADLFSDPETGMMVRLVRYPAGVINPNHTHPCGHGMFVLEGNLVTHRGSFGPGSFVWFPEGEAMEHGASADPARRLPELVRHQRRDALALPGDVGRGR